jgi:hypothetical protein
VFASDRTTYGREGYTNLFMFDVASGQLQYLTYGAWFDQDPRWSNDGSRIVFSSSRAGTYDLYTVDRAGSGVRLTQMTGGAFDPEWLPDDRSLVFAGFQEGSFRIFRFWPDADSAATPIALAPTPPIGNGAPLAWDWEEITSPVVAQSIPEQYNTIEKVSLDFAGGDAIVAPGLGTAQGAQFLMSDMLGNHIVFVGVSATQAQGISDLVDNFSGNLLYLNLSRRLNYGGGLFRFKGRFRDVAHDIYEEQTYGSYFIASYPFSKFERVELQLSLEKSDREDLIDIFEDGGGIPGGDTREDIRDLTRRGVLTSNYLSYVKDNTLWLPTGPIDGERFNLTAGLVTCFSCTVPSAVTGEDVSRDAAAEHYVAFADYRRYFRTSLYSAYAIRAYAFYSDGAIPARSVLGGTHRLRGYPRYSLTGSRLWLLNQEWRFPILHSLNFAFPFGDLRLPGIQGALFADLGSSWLENMSKPDGTWGSYGGSFRMSLGAPLVLRLDIGKRFAIGKEPPVLFSDGEKFGDTFVDFFFGFNY